MTTIRRHINSLRNIVAAILLAACVMNCPALAKDCAGKGNSGIAVVSAQSIREMNSSGFKALAALRRDAEAPGDVAVSPLGAWLVREVLEAKGANGGSQDVHAIFSKLNSVNAAQLESHIWIDDRLPTAKEALVAASRYCVETTAVHWQQSAPPNAENTPEDTLIASWLRKNAPLFSDQIDTDVSRNAVDWAESIRGANHPLNFLVALNVKATLPSPVGIGWTRSIHAFRSGSLSGIRLDALGEDLNVYFIFGSAGEIRSLTSRLDSDEWNKLRQSMQDSTAFLGSAAYVIASERRYSPGVESAFGAVVSAIRVRREAEENAALRILPGALQLNIVEGVAGEIYNGSETLSGGASTPHFPFFSAATSLLFAVEDRSTGALLLVGTHEASRCTYQKKEC